LRGKRKPHLFLASTPPRLSLWQISPADLMVSCLLVHTHILFNYSTDMFINLYLSCSSRPVF
jgi:hypothetical protein